MIELSKRIAETRQALECYECGMIKKTIIKSQKEYQQQRPDIGDLTNFNRHNMTRGFPGGGMPPVLLRSLTILQRAVSQREMEARFNIVCFSLDLKIL